jgi:hypothetical protein
MKLSPLRFNELFGGGQAMDRVRQQNIHEGPTLDYLGLFFYAIALYR